ncbi:MAG TPA: hypothetical protein VIX15_07350 [Streptosporangiaceae bacterium]
MEASEAGRRIFWRHRWLLIIMMILPAVGVFGLKEHQPVTYAATATIQGQGTTPDATTQVTAIQSRVSAVATAPTWVQNAITTAGVNRNAVQVARHEISVAPLSSSAIMLITVTDQNRQVAIALAGSLATVVVNELNQLGVQDNPELTALSKTNTALALRRNQLLSELNGANSANATTSVPVQSLLSQLGAAEQELAANESEQQQVLATLTSETGASVVSTPAYATGGSRHAAVYAGLAAMLGLVLGLLIATLREVMRPTVANPATGARELGAVLLGGSDERRGQVIRLDPDLPERLSLAAHRAGVLTIVVTGPGSPVRLATLAARLRAALPAPERADARPRVRASARANHDDASSNGDGRRPAMVGLATDIAAARPAKPQPTVVTLRDIRLGAPPPDAALVVALPRFAPHSALDQAADLGLTADWPILGVIGIRRRGRLTSRPVAAPDIRVLDKRLPDGAAVETNPDMPVMSPGPAGTAAADLAHADKVPDDKAKTPEGNHQEGEDD